MYSRYIRWALSFRACTARTIVELPLFRYSALLFTLVGNASIICRTPPPTKYKGVWHTQICTRVQFCPTLVNVWTIIHSKNLHIFMPFLAKANCFIGPSSKIKFLHMNSNPIHIWVKYIYLEEIYIYSRVTRVLVSRLVILDNCHVWHVSITCVSISTDFWYALLLYPFEL